MVRGLRVMYVRGVYGTDVWVFLASILKRQSEVVDTPFNLFDPTNAYKVGSYLMDPRPIMLMPFPPEIHRLPQGPHAGHPQRTAACH